MKINVGEEKIIVFSPKMDKWRGDPMNFRKSADSRTEDSL